MSTVAVPIPLSSVCLEQADDLALFIDRDGIRRRHPGQARHGHDVAADHNQELGPGRDPDFADRHREIGRRTLEAGVSREAVLGLRHAHRVVAETGVLEIGNLVELIDLFISNNRLIRVPETMGNMTSLERLYLSDNLLTGLPPEMDELVSKEIVLLSRNPISG